jgi:hypothetical protein
MRRYWLPFVLAVCLLVTLPIIYIQAQQLQSVRTILNDVWDKANRQLMTTAWIGGAASGQSAQSEQTIYNDVWDAPNHMLRTSGGGGAGGSGGPFNLTTTGVNSGQTLTVGNGSSLLKSGTGVIEATKWDIAPSPCGTNTFVTGQSVDKSFTCNQPTFSNLSGVATDAQIPELNTLSTSLTPGRCVEVDGTGKLSNAAAACGTGGGGGGDASTNTATSVDNEITLFSGTGGKLLKRATTTGMLKATAGVLTAATPDTDYSTPAALAAHAALTNAHSATDLNISSRIVMRDGLGNFSAGTITAALTGNATTASALVNDPVACIANNFVTDMAANGALTCTQPAFSNLSGVATDLQIPDLNTLSTGLSATRCVQTDGTGKLAVAAGACTTSASGDASTNSSTSVEDEVALFTGVTGKLLKRASSTGIPKLTSGVLSVATPGTDYVIPAGMTFSALSGTATDAQIPNLNTLSTGLTASRCVETDASGVLVSSGAVCGTSGGGGDFFGVASSVDGEVVLFNGTTGKQSRRATGTGLAVLTSGVLSATDPAACSANQFATDITGAGALSCSQVAFSNLSGTATDAQIPDINTLSTSLTPSRCVETDATGKLTQASALCNTLPADAQADGSTKGIAAFTAADFNASAGVISLDYLNGQTASASVKGYLSSSDWTIFNSKLSSSRTIATTPPLQGGGDLTSDRTLSIADAQADGSSKGAATFNAIDFNSSAGVISIDYANAQTASSATKGFLSPTDWTTFNNKPTSFAGLSGVATDAQIPDLNGLSTGLTPLKCVETDGAGRLSSTAQACGTGVTPPGDAAADGTTKGIATFVANDFNATSGVVAIDYANGQTASSSTKGFLSAGDWVTFSNKPSTFAGLGGTASDAQVPDLNVLSTGLLASRCVETDTSGNLTVSASTCNIAPDLTPYAKLNGPQVLTQTQIAPRAVAQTVTANAFTINLDTTDIAEVPVLAAPVTVNAPTATGSNPRPYQELTVSFAPTSAPRGITWNGIFSEAAGIPLPTSTTGDGSTWNLVKMLYNATLAKYVVVASTSGATRGITTLASSSSYVCNPLIAESCEMQNTDSPGTGVTLGIQAGTYTNGTKVLMRIRCTGSQALTLPTGTFLGSASVPLTGMTCASNSYWTQLGFIYSGVDTRWQLHAFAN